MNIVWFKRDLRIEDHEPLFAAAKQGKIIPLYIFEPDLWQQPDMSLRHYTFLCDCLTELDRSLSELGQKLIIKVGAAVDVLSDLHKKHSIQSIWSHQETWNGWTYERDKAVKNWCKSQSVLWHEPTQNGVIRGLKLRDGWASHWYKKMQQPIITRPGSLAKISEHSERVPSPKELKLASDNYNSIQQGGRSRGLELLHSFLYDRGKNYTMEMSSPVTAFDSCSRLSTHLAFGTVSIREVFQACESRAKEIKLAPFGERGTWSRSLKSFSSRLRWHCHFIQKLEDEPNIEFQNMHSDYDEIRDEFNEDFFEAWKTGQTGYPMIDACMRALTATGWLNFRMRAMVISFASQHLWLHWRKTALHLAKLFTDYEPGIHYSQVQMQSCTTGINAIRIYNPIKQSFDQDPEGIFIRKWVKELRTTEQLFIHTPWEVVSEYNSYPLPIVDEKTARKKAADAIYALRRDNLLHREKSQKILKKHGSRKSNWQRKSRKKVIKNSAQGELF